MVGAMLEDMPSRTYWMIVEGDLSERLTFAFGGMPSTRSEGTTAALTTRIRDQAELQGRAVRGRPWAHLEERRSTSRRSADRSLRARRIRDGRRISPETCFVATQESSLSTSPARATRRGSIWRPTGAFVAIGHLELLRALLSGGFGLTHSGADAGTSG